MDKAISPGEALGRLNRERVRLWFVENIGGTKRECGAALGLSVSAVGRHVARIRAERK